MHSSLCLTRTLFSRLLEWRDGSHSCGTQWICRDRDDAGGERRRPQSPKQQSEPSSSASPEPTNLSHDSSFPLAYTSLCTTLFSRLLGWHNGSHACGKPWIWVDGPHVCDNTWTCRDRDDAGGEGCRPQSPRQREPTSSASPEPTNLSHESSLPLAHTSLCAVFSRLLGWHDGSHVGGSTWTCRDRDDAGGERYKAQSPRQCGEPSFALHLSPSAL